MCLPVGGLPDLECLSVDNTSWGVQMLGSCCPSMYLLAVFPLCPFLVSGGFSCRQHKHQQKFHSIQLAQLKLHISHPKYGDKFFHA